MKRCVQRKESDMSEKKFDAVVIGVALIDCVIKGFDPEPISSRGFHAESLTLAPGGEAFNQCMTAARLGAKVQIVCGLAEDASGDLICHQLQCAGTDTSAVIMRTEPGTPVTTMFVDGDGNRKSITGNAHAYNIHPEKYLEPLLSNADAVSLGSLFRAPFNDPDVIRAVLEMAKSHGLTIYADTKLPNARKLTLEDLKECLPMVDYITPNEDEALYYTGESDPEKAADVFLGYGIKNVIIKLGARGCFFKNASEKLRLPSYRIDAVDATGAGDNFLAGFVTARADGCGHEEALKFATACAAICTMSIGATTGVKSREQVLEFMREHELL